MLDYHIPLSFLGSAEYTNTWGMNIYVLQNIDNLPSRLLQVN